MLNNVIQTNNWFLKCDHLSMMTFEKYFVFQVWFQKRGDQEIETLKVLV